MRPFPISSSHQPGEGPESDEKSRGTRVRGGPSRVDMHLHLQWSAPEPTSSHSQSQAGAGAGASASAVSVPAPGIQISTNMQGRHLTGTIQSIRIAIYSALRTIHPISSPLYPVIQSIQNKDSCQTSPLPQQSALASPSQIIRASKITVPQAPRRATSDRPAPPRHPSCLAFESLVEFCRILSRSSHSRVPVRRGDHLSAKSARPTRRREKARKCLQPPPLKKRGRDPPKWRGKKKMIHTPRLPRPLKRVSRLQRGTRPPLGNWAADLFRRQPIRRRAQRRLHRDP